MVLVDDVTNQSNVTESASTHISVPHSESSSNNNNDLAAPHVLNLLQNFIAAQCEATYSLQPLYYHIGCAFFLLAFLAPSYRYGTALYMRCMLTFGCILFLMWSYLSECRPDVLIWTLLFIFVNIIHMAILICKLRPVKFDKEIEEVSVCIVVVRESSIANSHTLAHCWFLVALSRALCSFVENIDI
jgi:hypothetical protein